VVIWGVNGELRIVTFKMLSQRGQLFDVKFDGKKVMNTPSMTSPES
jgi:hypothetical protein